MGRKTPAVSGVYRFIMSNASDSKTCPVPSLRTPRPLRTMMNKFCIQEDRKRDICQQVGAGTTRLGEKPFITNHYLTLKLLNRETGQDMSKMAPEKNLIYPYILLSQPNDWGDYGVNLQLFHLKGIIKYSNPSLNMKNSNRTSFWAQAADKPYNRRSLGW